MRIKTPLPDDGYIDALSVSLFARRIAMAEAHSAVAFQFSVTHHGVSVKMNHGALRTVILNFVKRSLRRAKVSATVTLQKQTLHS